jgi:type I restriction enzyme S subunit
MNAAPPVGWSPKKLDELGFVGRGKSKHRPRNDPALYGGPYPFVQTGNVKAADLYISRYDQTYSEQGLAQSKPWDPGTLCITIAANIAETAILKIQACFPDSIVGFIADPLKADVQFVKYCIDTVKLQMQNASKGTTQDNLSLDKLLTFDLLTPPLPTQRKIAAILSAYDDLIEVNTRRIAILEEMGRALYREWFVHFRFPGHESVRMVESAVGLVPEGWEVRLLSDFVEVPRENINPAQFPDETFAHFSIPAYDEGRMPVLEMGETIKSGKFRLSQPCVLLSKLNPRIPRVWYTDPEAANRAICSSEFLVLTPKPPVNRVFLYGMCTSQEFLDTFAGLALGTSTSHQRAKPDDMLRLPRALPPASLMTRFARQVEPMLGQISLSRRKNANLRQTRDLLLPRLVSGEADLSGLDVHE